MTISSGAELYLECDFPLCTEVLRCGDMLIRVSHNKRSGAEICCSVNIVHITSGAEIWG